MGLIADERPAIANLLHTASLTQGNGMQSYLTMMAVRLLEMRRVLKDTGGTLKKCVNSQAVYPLSEQDGLEAQERRYTAHEEGKH